MSFLKTFGSIYKRIPRFLLVMIIALIVAGGLLPLLNNGYLTYLAFVTMIYVVLATAWNIVGGFAGQTSLANAAFFGVGIYTSSLVWKATSSPLLGIPLSAATASALALAMIPFFRLRGAYFAMGTFFLTIVVGEVVNNATPLTGGAIGIYLPIEAPSMSFQYYASFLLALFVIFVAIYIASSKLGMAMIGIREDEGASIAAGVDAMRTKIMALVISAALTGVAGAVYTFSLSYVDPSSAFSLNWVIISVFPAVVGGIGTIVGPIIGAVFFSLLDQMLSVYGAYSLIIFGILLILVVLLLPRGIYTTLMDKFGKQPFVRPSTKIAGPGRGIPTPDKTDS